jgi:DNA-directed RNA polymerase specialized sigma24 family protein
MVAVRIVFVAARKPYVLNDEHMRLDAQFERHDLELPDAQSFRDANQRIKDHVRRVVRAEAMRIATTRTIINIAPFDHEREDRPWTKLFVHANELRESLLLSEHAWTCVQAVLSYVPYYHRKIIIRVDLDANSEAETKRVMLALGAWRNGPFAGLPSELLQRIAWSGTV